MVVAEVGGKLAKIHNFTRGSGEGDVFGLAWAERNIIIFGAGVGGEGCIVGGADRYCVGRLRATIGLDGVCGI